MSKKLGERQLHTVSQLDPGIQAQQCGDKVGGGKVTGAEIAAEGSRGADGRVGRPTCGLCQRGKVGLPCQGSGNVGVRRGGADADAVGQDLNAAEFWNAADGNRRDRKPLVA